MTQHSSRIFSISTGSSEPIYRQLIDQVRRLVVGGQLLEGDSLPSVREVAQELALNPMTVSKVYNLLEMEGILQRKRGQGMYVAPRKHELQSQEKRLDLLRPTLQRAAMEARQLELDAQLCIDLFNQILKEEK